MENRGAHTVATYVALTGLGLGTLLIFGPMVSPAIGHWLFSMGFISGVTAERMAWGPIALFGTAVPGGIAYLVGLISLVIAVVLRIRLGRSMDKPQ
jgi:hypothetical protein